MNSNKRRNVGIFAHIDAGKTTTTEQMLFKGGQTRSLGSVDTGTAQTDWLEVERERGISVLAATTELEWRETKVNLIDTPGHVDFLSEVERSLRVMDGAILIISAVEGIQPQTEVIWHALRKLNIPTLIYLNKMDRIGANPKKVMESIKQELSSAAVPIQYIHGVEESFQGVSSWHGEDVLYDQIIEVVSEFDHLILNQYLEGEDISCQKLIEKCMELSKDGEVFPVLYGASNKGLGIKELMDAMIDFLPPPNGSINAPLSGVVFKIERDKKMGRLAYVRLFQGRVQNRDVVYNATQDVKEKVTQIRKILGDKSEDVGELIAGDIAALSGLSEVSIGDILGSVEGVPEHPQMAVPLLTVQVEWEKEEDYPKIVKALQELSDEDPLLDLQWLQEERELHIKVMGKIQLEILTSLMHDRYHLDVEFGQPSVIYKETPSQAGEGLIRYTMPKPCWAVLKFKIEPGDRGSGLTYHSVVRKEDLLERYQNEVARRIPAALEQGLCGWNVIDLKITLIEGEHHVVHTHPLDFAVATPMGIMNGLAQTGTKLLEPMLNFRISIPEQFGGKVLHDLSQMRATFEAPMQHEDRMVVEGIIPLATSMEYAIELASLTKGKGSIMTFFHGYKQCPEGFTASRVRRGINPLDQSKYILSVRKALT
ncbi:GTP-binding protein [Chengkuizengella axinellae]|uniref:TetM/TetW/TetO/TetS family tetracycline resistance ribosomal protection protein n=1 Tax=Chengkuizengella axinellae TaxID=3064388 RepID=A0ABT9J065_9BACL|nr:TetM/TetW/TetO/TetS family tetracycline resistance ribosomal protection protein [Chengkuizengella sp. 2205SS18-9]MDP5275014.1 TetM/TetW/TetO/TetS family tetracycline resistance ribosomal protection protein [Chengkuizengella sp. 2205SS18-9]